jgi:anoctamin-1
MELTLQLAVIFMGKQFLLSVLEYYTPLLWKLLNLVKLAGWRSGQAEETDTPQHIRDFKLVEWGRQGLFYEYLEMVIQYGFITIFVCAFPLAPLFALLNNILELRLDAKKILEQHRRPIAQKVRSIGVWFDIMETVGRISIITNALIIALTSEFIPKLVFKYFYSTDGSLAGYVDFSLSQFALADLDPMSRVVTNASECRYPDYNHGPGDPATQYTPNVKFFHIWFARLLFVVVFQNVLGVTVMALKLLIPDMPSGLRQRIRSIIHRLHGAQLAIVPFFCWFPHISTYNCVKSGEKTL